MKNICIERNNSPLRNKKKERREVIFIKKKYRAKELALFIGVGLSTIWRWNKEGKIKSQKISNGVTVFDIDEVISDLGL
ncbi:hypothetical protein CPG37_08905 [Malaciobacter canalis]|uniref:Helix-turn-helix domain-containing protein n=1 Tax=Malaciobacter canalis TaxID=1912871 RepID=A0ABX4LNZ9_9BACT|nr:hypothetical protein [Malaciobacter canalis]PHO09609.1 hypothetical protein CPG37_08905 [Malaciobacter canalis]QEE31678.1 hypothetical protein ACAN_0142 [Malaciobacter canalis]